MIKQLRSSAGLWVSYEGANLLIDPGPGCIVRCNSSRPKMDPGKLDGILLTHRHLDHSNDINVMIEAMTEGGFKKRGVVFLPKDAIVKDPVILKHLRNAAEDIVILKANKKYRLKAIEFQAPCRQEHSVETYGLRFNFPGCDVAKKVSLISDTRYFEGLKSLYKADVIILNVVFYDERPEIEHLSLSGARKLISEIKPKAAVITHFGMSMLKNKPAMIAKSLSEELGIRVIAAYDGMKFDLN